MLNLFSLKFFRSVSPLLYLKLIRILIILCVHLFFGSLQQVQAAANQSGNQWRIQQCLLQVRQRLVRATVKLCAS